MIISYVPYSRFKKHLEQHPEENFHFFNHLYRENVDDYQLLLKRTLHRLDKYGQGGRLSMSFAVLLLEWLNESMILNDLFMGMQISFSLPVFGSRTAFQLSWDI